MELLTRKLPPWHGDQGKRLVKSSKVSIRDSGLVHSLLGITDMDSLLSHPVVDASNKWSGETHANGAAPSPWMPMCRRAWTTSLLP
jgi:hypothetical protein